MNILIINHYAGSDKYGMEFRPFYFGRELVKQGHAVTVIAAGYSHLRRKNPDVCADFTEEWIEGIRYVWMKTPAYRKNDLRRLLNMAAFLRKLKQYAPRIAAAYRPDAVVASSTYPYDVREARRIADCCQNPCRVLYEIHDLWPLSLIELYHLSEKNPYIRSLQKAENSAYRLSDGVISILPHADRHIHELGFTDVPFYYVPNGVATDGKDEEAPAETAAAVARARAMGKCILMYLGGFSKANALDDLLEAAPLMPFGIQLFLIGNGPLKAEIAKKVERENLQNVTLLDAVPKPRVQGVLRLADALYIGAKRTPLYRYGVGMNKIYDYMLSGRPILYAVESSNNPVAEVGCGIRIAAEDPQEIASAARMLLQMTEEERARLGENGRRYVRQYHDYRVLAGQFAAACAGEDTV